MNILFITSSRIGDAVLSTGLLDHIARAHPQTKVTIVCGPLTTSLFEGYPNLERILPLKKQKYNRHWFDLWRQASGTRWDMIVDLRNSLVSRLLRADRKFIFGSYIDPELHKVEQNAAIMKLDYVPAPKLWFTAEQNEKASQLIPSLKMSSPGLTGGSRETGTGSSAFAEDDRQRVLAIGPTANWLAKTWPADRFIEIIKFMTGENGPMPGARVAVFAAPGEEPAAYEVLNSIPENRRINVIAKTDPGTAAAALARCNFYIGNDSGLMHCAAAVGVKTLGLFGPSWPHLYRPWGAHCNYVATPENFDELIAYEGYTPKTAPCLMTSLTIEAVKDRLQKF